MDERTNILGVGLHVCTSIQRTDDGNIAGRDCDQAAYSSMDVLYACVVGRPPTATRGIHFFLNDSIVEKVSDETSSNIVYMHPLDERFVGTFRIVYVENGCNYWAREFVMGACPTTLHRPDIEVSRLVDLLRKFRT